MNVGIITHHGLPNFGANLQALSTSLALKRLGHNPVVIDYKVREIEKLYASRTAPEQVQKHNEFVKEHLNVSEPCFNGEEVKKAAEKCGFDAVMSGSDAVLRLDLSRSHREDMCYPNPFWLNWASEVGIEKTGILAGSSMGSNYLLQPRAVRKEIKKGIEKLSYCSVRDRWTLLMLRACGVANDLVNTCPDPVTQVVMNEMLEMTPHIYKPDEKFVLVGAYASTASKGWFDGLRKCLNETGYKLVGLPQPDHPVEFDLDIELPLPMSPLEWLAWINASDGYIGVRFHPIVISQALGKPFVALDYYDKSISFQNRYLGKLAQIVRPFTRFVSKTYDLSKRVGLEKYVVPRRNLKKMSPQAVADLFKEAKKEVVALDKRESRAHEFDTVLKKILQ